MFQKILSQVLQELHPKRLLPSLTAGLVAGIVTIVIVVSFAAMIFAGDLSGYISSGIGFTLLGGFVTGIVVALVSSLPGTVTLPQDSPAAILALVSTVIVGSMPASATKADAFATVVAAVVITSLATGVFFLMLGTFKLGGLVRYIPYPVVGGFLAGTGWLVVQGSMGVIADVSFSFSQFDRLFQADALVRWGPAFAFAALLLLILRRYSHFLIVPTMIFLAIGLFYLVLWLAGFSVEQASAQGWLLGPFPEGGLWQPLVFTTLNQVNWSVVLGQFSSLGTILVISLVSVLLNASGLELAVQRDVDLDRELRSAGLANLVAGLGGSPVSYHSLSLSTLGHRVGVSSRLTGVFAAALCGVVLFVGAPALTFFPKPVLGSLLLFLGLDFLVTWLYDAWFKLSKAEYLIVVLILVAMNVLGVLEGVGLGLVLAIVLFVVNYSRINVVKHALSGANYRSNVDRPRLCRQLLRQKGDWLYILELQGFIFFGTADKLLERVRQRIACVDLPSPRFIVMDFRQVSGLDASAVLSFAKMKQLTQGRDIRLVFTHLSPRMQRQLEREVFKDGDGAVWRLFSDLDHGVEWCEEQMIQVFADVGLVVEPKTARQQFEDFLCTSEKLVGLFEYLATGESERAESTQAKPLDATSLMRYAERQEVEEGHVLIHQGAAPHGLYFLEEGQATAHLEYEDGRTVRLRTMKGGTIVGEVGLYLGHPASASVVADQRSTLYYLSADKLKEMGEAEPELAVAFHKFVAQLLSERLVSATDTLQAVLQ